MEDKNAIQIEVFCDHADMAHAATLRLSITAFVPLKPTWKVYPDTCPPAYAKLTGQ